MAEALPNDRLRRYLRELKPEARALLAEELERAALRGDEPPGASAILEELRAGARHDGRRFSRVGNPQRLFFMPVEPFLVDDTPERKHRGRVSRVCLGPMWEWVCRDLMPDEAKTYVDQVSLLLSTNEKNGAEQVARAFQDLAEQRMREALGAARTDDKLRRRLAGQIGTPHAIEDVREIAAIFKVRDALAVIASQLPPTISNLADEQFEEVSALLDSPIGRHRDVFLYALLVVMGRLGSPWQLIRLGIHAAKSDVAARIAETPFAVAVDVVLTDIERMISTLRSSLKAGLSGEVASLLKEIHDTARALHTEMDLSTDSPWARQLAASRVAVSKLLEGRNRKPARPSPPPAASAQWEGVRSRRHARCRRCRRGRGEARARRRLPKLRGRTCDQRSDRARHSDLQNYFDSGTQILLDRLRTSPPGERSFRQSQVDAAVRFCARLFGPGYASLLAKAADIAAKGEQKAAKA